MYTAIALHRMQPMMWSVVTLPSLWQKPQLLPYKWREQRRYTLFSTSSTTIRRVVPHVNWSTFRYHLDAVIAPKNEINTSLHQICTCLTIRSSARWCHRVLPESAPPPTCWRRWGRYLFLRYYCRLLSDLSRNQRRSALTHLSYSLFYQLLLCFNSNYQL